MPKVSRDLVAILLLVTFITLFFLKELVTDQTIVTYRLENVYPWLGESGGDDLEKPSITSDCTFSYYPRRVFATRQLRRGEIPFWNPHQFCGIPFLATFQSAVFYPINMALYGLDPPAQMDFFIYIHFLIAAVFSFLLARKLGISTIASSITSVTFTFCGFMITRYGQPTFISTASWLPALVLLGEHLRENPTWKRAGLLVIGLVLTILSGFPQLVIYNVYIVGCYLITRSLLEKNRRWRERVLPIAFMLVAVVVAGIICSYQILPTYELSKFSYRKMLPFGLIASSAHTRLAAIKYFIPDVLGNPVDLKSVTKIIHGAQGGSRFSHNYVSTTGYVGILPLLLALIAVLRPSRKIIPFVILAGLSLLIVFGTGLLRIVYHLPGFNFSRIDRIIIAYMFSVAILAGYGFDEIFARSDRRVPVLAICFAGFAIVLSAWIGNVGLNEIIARTGGRIPVDIYRSYALRKIIFFVILSLLASTFVGLAWRRKLSLRAFTVATLCILLVDLLPQAVKFKVTQKASDIMPHSVFVDEMRSDRNLWRFAKFGADVFPSNTATILGFDDIHGYDALNVNHYIEVLGVIDSTVTSVSNAALRRRIGPFGKRSALGSKLLDLLNVKYILSVADVGGGRPQAIRWINKDCLPRAFLVTGARFFETYDAILEYMKSDDFDPAREVLLKGSQYENISKVGESSAGKADIAVYEPNRVKIDVVCERSCYLVLSDVWYPGWKVSVDGKASKVLRADYALRAVEVKPGNHTVEFIYSPQSFKLGLVLTVAGLALLGAMLLSKKGFWDQSDLDEK